MAHFLDHPANLQAWEYTRKSQNEAHDPEILAKHHALLARTALADGVVFPPAASYEEIGTGERISARPVFQRLLTLWEHLAPRAGGMVYVTELSRLSRGLPTDQGRVMDALMRADIKIRTPGKIYDLHLFEDRFAFMALALVANAELEFIKQRFANGKAELLLQGKIRNGRVPFGYVWDAAREEPAAGPGFDILVRCCREALTTSVTQLADRYGVPRGSLYKALKSPVICGWPVSRHRASGELDPRGRPTTRLVPRDQWRWPLAVNDRYPHACTREEWEALQVVLAERHTRGIKTAPTDGWCVDVVYFQAADRPGRRGTYSGRGVQGPTYEYREPDGHKLYILRQPVHVVAAASLAELFADPRLFLAEQARWEAARAARAGAAPRSEDLLAERARRERQLVDLLERELDATGAAARAIATLRQRLEGQIDALTQTIREDAGQRLLAGAGLAAPGLSTWLAIGDAFPEAWEETDEAERRALARFFFQEIRVRVEGRGRGLPLTRTILPPRFRFGNGAEPVG